MKYKILKQKMKYLQKYVGKVGIYHGTKNSPNTTYICLILGDDRVWFFEERLKKEK